MEEDIEKLIKELTKVRPEMLNEEALKLFNTIIAIIDERDYLLKAYKQDEKMIDLMAEHIVSTDSDLCEFLDMTTKCKYYAGENKKLCNDCIKEFFRKKVETNE